MKKLVTVVILSFFAYLQTSKTSNNCTFNKYYADKALYIISKALRKLILKLFLYKIILFAYTEKRIRLKFVFTSKYLKIFNSDYVPLCF